SGFQSLTYQAISANEIALHMFLATELLSLQRQLSQWKLRWSELWNSEPERQQIADTALHWGEQLQGQLK
ncbi:MAG: hypothetical protein DCF25_10115, partial [Leptolyngbya foveolarum]